jgi:hypothetical protein
VIPVIVSLRAMFDAIHAFKFLDGFVPCGGALDLDNFAARAGKLYGKGLA